MFIYTLKFDKKKAVFAVIIAALIIIGIILLVGAHDRKNAAADTEDRQQTAQREKVRADVNGRNEKNRVAYLAQYGWEVESPALSEDTVVIPRSFSQVFESYNTLQKAQGFDLSEYCGMEVTLYTYRVLNGEYANDDVLAELYVSNGCVIGGDIHSTALDGFMCGIKK